MTNLSIDEMKFSKTSKKLLNHFKSKHDLNLKLSEMQEILAQSLGFRNLHDLQNILSEQTVEKENKVQEHYQKPQIFQNIELDQAIQIITNLMSSGDNDMWRGRAISLISSVMTCLIHMRDEKEIVLDVDVINEYLILDNLIKLYKTRRDFPTTIRNSLKIYLTSLPGFQEASPKQNDTVIEQHGYLQMQFTAVFYKLKKIEDNNFIIADYRWFNEIKENKELSLKSELNKLDFLEDSWLATNEYEELMVSMKNKEFIFKVNDLLIYITTIISSGKRHKMHLLLKSILDNYSVASKISKKITEAIK
jgi:hypothetical protein